MHGSKGKYKHVFSTSHYQVMSSHSTGKKASVCVVVVLEGKYPPFPFLLTFIAKHDVIWHEIPLQSAWIRCSGCVSSKHFAYRNPTGFWGWELGTIQSISGLSTLC